MSDMNKKLSEITNIVSNKEEAEKVLAIVTEILGDLEDKIMNVEKRELMLEEKMAEVMEMLAEMEEELVTVLNEDFEAECPYCGETIPFKIPEDGEDFECPECHNVIELEMMLGDECGCGCDDCSSCDHDDCDCDDCGCDHEEEEE